MLGLPVLTPLCDFSQSNNQSINVCVTQVRKEDLPKRLYIHRVRMQTLYPLT